MSTRENRQERPGKPNFKNVPVEEQKRLSKEAMKEEDSEFTNEDVAEEAVRKLDEKRTNPENLHVDDDYSAHLG